MKHKQRTESEIDLDHPARFEELPAKKQAALMAWIGKHFEASRQTYWLRSSYGLKHDFQRDTGIYVYNGAFKGAMLKAGIVPADEKEQNWHFKMKEKVQEGFYGWCVQRYRRKDTPLGDLARDMEMDPKFPQGAATREEIFGYMKGRHACDGAVRTLEKAWKYYTSVPGSQAMLKQNNSRSPRLQLHNQNKSKEE